MAAARRACRRSVSPRPRLLTDYDLYLFGEGNTRAHLREARRHLITRGGVEGVHFAVWAPNARRPAWLPTSTPGTDGRHPMRKRGGFGSLITGVAGGEKYKFELLSEHGEVLLKSSLWFRVRAAAAVNASVVTRLDYVWRDGA